MVLKKGEHSAGVKRQYSGTAGGVDNCQVRVFCLIQQLKELP
ncbi:MAG: transposase [Trueperaceae bacterium]|nr:transposase [Trueperaceae bacterium]